MASSILESAARYEASSIAPLTEALEAGIAKGVFDLELSLGVVRLYQLYPAQVNKETLALVLSQLLLFPSQQAFLLASYMLPASLKSEAPFTTIFAMSDLFETGQFAELQKKKTELSAITDRIQNFDITLAEAVVSVLSLTYKSIAAEELAGLAGQPTDALDAIVAKFSGTISGATVSFEQTVMAEKPATSDHLDFQRIASALLSK
eukprot:TRINITY_DN7967_c0_g1_i1.p1 TRINITY_DN7967_c0_g1~~TRINITY_DN7967_c0_g1_i1.p1  ORF type:complete len:216 (-),score=80.34 TRINITY_DN7967_c0_g1_i1:197-814(-)